MDEDTSAQATPMWVVGNALLIGEALNNLIDNALHYAGVGAQVTVRTHTQGVQAVLTVTDTGPGIAEADRERVMERFVRGTDTGNGCGLGLAIVREIIERHQGTVTLADAVPHGLRVILTLPLAASQEH
jgi:two-component system sensor histidine kinase TctE